MESQKNQSRGDRIEIWIALALCAGALLVRITGQFIGNQPDTTGVIFTDWIPIILAVLAAAGMILLNDNFRWRSLERALNWSALLLMIWSANGLPFDLLDIAGLRGAGINWNGMAARTLALTAAIVLAHLALSRHGSTSTPRAAGWYGYAAFVLALPYPAIRAYWAMGGMAGLDWPGAAGHGPVTLMASLPWLSAAVLSLLLVPTWRWMPRRLLLVAGWSATAIVSMVGPAACWALITRTTVGDLGLIGIASWVPYLFYSSWFLWAIAAGAATRSYQIRSAAPQLSPVE